MDQPSLFDPEPILLTIPEAARRLSIGRTMAYELISAGELEVVHTSGEPPACPSRRFGRTSNGGGPRPPSGPTDRFATDGVDHPPYHTDRRRPVRGPLASGPGVPERSRRFLTRSEAKAFAAQTEANQSRGVTFDPSGGRIHFRLYAERWLEGRTLADSTRDNYVESLELHVYPTFGRTPIGKIAPDEVRRWYRPLRERVPSSAARSYRIMRAVLATAVEDELIPRNPCRIKGAGSDPHTERPYGRPSWCSPWPASLTSGSGR